MSGPPRHRALGLALALVALLYFVFTAGFGL